MSAITAAVVGAIASLAMFFAAHVFWPQGAGAGPDLVAVALAACGFVALWRNALGMVPLILILGVAGAAYRFLSP